MPLSRKRQRFFLMYVIFCAPNFAKLFFSEIMSHLFLCGNLLPFASSLAFFNANLQDLMQDVAFSFANRCKCLRNSQLPPPEGGGLWPRRAPIFPTRRTVRHGFCPCYRVQWAFTAVAGGIAGVKIGLCGMESQ